MVLFRAENERLIGLRLGRNQNAERASLVFLRIDVDFPIVQFDDFFDDGQTQSDAVIGSRRIALKVFVENVLLHFFAHPDAVVFDRNEKSVFDPGRSQTDFSAFGRIFDRIVDQIDPEFFDEFAGSRTNAL